MDPITQGLTGAVMSQSFSKKDNIRIAAVAGWIGGMLADADVFLRFGDDHLTSLLFHRHFTHSFIFIPLGGLLASLMLWPFLKKRMPFGQLLFFTTLGYATHGLLDACTSYGTLLLWPFSQSRIAWDNVAIIDPLFSGLLILSMIIAFINKRAGFARAGLILGLCYLLLGAFFNDRAKTELANLAKERGHEITRMRAMPTLGNILLWRGVYETEKVFYVDAVRVGVLKPTVIYPGGTTQKIETLPRISKDSVYYRDFLKFAHFADGFLFLHPTKPNFLGDLRYAMLPNVINTLWGIEYIPESEDKHAAFIHTERNGKKLLKPFFKMLRGYPGESAVYAEEAEKTPSGEGVNTMVAIPDN